MLHGNNEKKNVSRSQGDAYKHGDNFRSFNYDGGFALLPLVQFGLPLHFTTGLQLNS